MTSPSPRGPQEQAFIDAARDRRWRLMNAGKPKPKMLPPLLPVLPLVSARPLEISRYSPQWPTRHSQVHAIIQECADKHGIRVQDLKGPRRSKGFIPARHEAMYRLSEEMPNLSLPQIGRILGGRDHSTVIYGIKQHKKRAGL